MIAVEFDRVTVTYQRTVALESVSFRLGQGELLGVIGPNGSGKTTLLRTILGLVKPIAGEVTVLGLQGKEITRVRSRIGYVPQRKPIDPNFPISVLDVVLMGTHSWLRPFHLTRREEKEKGQAVLKAVGLLETANHLAGHLSGGQQQKLFLAQALVKEPQLLLLDEPTTGVDVATRRRMVELVHQIHKERGLTTIYVTHDLNEIMPYVDRVMFLNRTVRAFGACSEMLTSETLNKLYGIPVVLVTYSGRRYLITEDRHE